MNRKVASAQKAEKSGAVNTQTCGAGGGAGGGGLVGSEQHPRQQGQLAQHPRQPGQLEQHQQGQLEQHQQRTG